MGGDPTPLAKCQVAVSKAEPLVTEWPASEKSRLEALITRGAVVVSYSGCEMQILDACTAKGTYGFQKTTLATDTVDITSEDDLYAKLPLGAVRLEGDLKRSGRLAVKTTVAGQFALNGGGVKDVPDDGECAKATHLVTGLSIGAFKLLSGGKQSASVSGSVVGVGGAGGSGSREETTLTEAGDPKACTETTEKPNDNCKSPLQIFLQPLPGRHAGPTTARAGVEEEKPPPGAVRVNFASSSATEHWSVLDGHDKVLCDLPCSRWVGPNSGYKLQLDAAKKDDIVVIPMPKELGYSAGRTVDARPQPSALAAPITGAVMAGAGYVTLLIGLFGWTVPTNANNNHPDTSVGIPVMAVGGGLMVIGTGLMIFAGRWSSGIEMTLAPNAAASTRAPVRLGPGYVEANGNRDFHLVVTPGGAFGAF